MTAWEFLTISSMTSLVNSRVGGTQIKGIRVASNEEDFVIWAAAAISGVLVANSRLPLNKT